MITIIDYNAGNITSVKRALDSLGIANTITNDPDVVQNAERLIFPGVGHATQAMDTLNRSGLGHALLSAHAGGIPVMGICLGCQIALTRSEEGDTQCLGLIEGTTRLFNIDTTLYKVPHMGWNEISLRRAHPVLDGIGSEFYFVHSYYVQPDSDDDIIATSDHGIVFPAVIGRKNFIAAQFHPEKSGPGGLKMLRNFSEWEGK